MSRLIKKASKKVGLPPGTIVHIGEEKTDKARITVIDYDEAAIQEKECWHDQESLQAAVPVYLRPIDVLSVPALTA